MFDHIASMRAFEKPIPKGVIHIGAHVGDEAKLYLAYDIKNQVWVEPQPEYYAVLLGRVSKNPDAYVYKLACGSKPGTAKMNILQGNQGMSNSLMKPKVHLEYYPKLKVCGEIEVEIETLDNIVRDNEIDLDKFDTIIIDVQGYELEVLKGAAKTMLSMNHAWIEVNNVETYEGCPLVDEVDAFMADYAMMRIHTHWFGPNKAYGDALYAKG
jgi:FkbM family methyltransferase